MPRKVRDAKLDTRTARAKLEMRREPHWRVLSAGRALGYRRGASGGSWIARYRTPSSGKQHYRALGAADDALDANGSDILTFAQAQERARGWFAELEAPRLQPAAPYSVSDAADDYLAWFQEHKKSHRETEYTVEAFIKPELGDVPVAELTTERIRTWLTSMARSKARLRTRKGAEQRRYRDDTADPDEGQRRRRSTANRKLAVLKALLNHAWRDGKVESDAAWRKVSPYKGVDAARRGWLEQKDCARLVNACEAAFRPMLQAALLTGCRYGELAGVRVGDYSADAGTLHIRASKSGKARDVVLTDEGRSFFDAVTAGKARKDLTFTRADGEPWGKAHQTRPMREACKAAKIVPAVSIHAMRHTYASLLVMNGVPLIVVAQNLGHADTRMVEKHYGHLAPSFIAKAIREGAPKLGIVSKSQVVPIRKHRKDEK